MKLKIKTHLNKTSRRSVKHMGINPQETNGGGLGRVSIMLTGDPPTIIKGSSSPINRPSLAGKKKYC